MTSIGARALLERKLELEALRDGLDCAAARAGTLTLIEGPAGVGKTELVREARAAAERMGMLTLAADGSELEQPFAFGVVRQLLEPIVTRGAKQVDPFAGAAGPAARLFGPHEQRFPTAEAGFGSLHSLYWLVVNVADQAPCWWRSMTVSG